MIVYRSMFDRRLYADNYAVSVGGGILDAPFARSTVTRGVKDAALLRTVNDHLYEKLGVRLNSYNDC